MRDGCGPVVEQVLWARCCALWQPPCVWVADTGWVVFQTMMSARVGGRDSRTGGFQ